MISTDENRCLETLRVFNHRLVFMAGWAFGHRELVRTKQKSQIKQIVQTPITQSEVTFLSSPLLTYLLQSLSVELS